MKKKGFTLIELLAVILIIAVISLITVPVITELIGIARKNTLKLTCSEIYKSYEQYEIGEETIVNKDVCILFDFDKNITESIIVDNIKYEPIDKLNLKGEIPKSGKFTICEEEKTLIIDNGKYTCIKNINKEEILEGSISDNDITIPTLKNISLSSTTNSIRVVVDTVEEDRIIKYYYMINGEEKISSSNIEIYKGLDKKTEYTVEVYVENNKGLKSNKIEKKISTKDINNPQFEVSQSPEGTEYATSKKITILYDSQEGLNHYFKSSVSATVSSGVVTASCGIDTEPKNCTSSSVTTIEANTWYETTSTTPSVIYKKNGTLYALTSDGKNISETSTYEISKIDASAPNASISVGSIKTDRVTITATCSDIESGITKYEYSKDNGATWVSRGTTSSHTFKGLTKDTEYTYKIRCTNGSGLKKTASSKESTLGFTNPTIEQTGQMPESGYAWATKRVIKITYSSTNIENPKYYFKSSVSATVASGVVTATCGTDTEPKNCTSSSVTTLEANTWYETTSTTPSVTYTANGTLYALTGDGKNVSGTSSYTVSKIDTSAPGATTITYNGGSNTCSWKNNYNLTLSASDNVGIAYYEIDHHGNGTVDETTGSNFIPVDGWSTCTAIFRAVDHAGNRGPWTEVQHIHMDTTPPAEPSVPDLIPEHDTGVSNTDNVTMYWYQVHVKGTAEPGMTIHLRISNISDDIVGAGTVDANGNWEIPINLHQNTWNNIYAWSVDAAGNYTQQPNYLSVYSDTIAPSVPTITYNGGSNSCSWKNNYNLTLNSSDATGIWKYQTNHNMDGTVHREIGSNFIPENGYSTCTDRYRAVDGAGNVSEWTEAQHIHMDTSAPTHTNWWWGEVTTNVARLYIQATDNVAIARVRCIVSTASGGYTNWYGFDTVWDSNANAYRCDITPGTFGHYNQTYKVQAEIYDHAGNGGYYNQTSVAIPAACAYNVGQTWDYGYTGGVQTFTVPCSGTYKLEVWGAQGGKSTLWNGDSIDGVYGDYAYGSKVLTNGTALYVTVGGMGGASSNSTVTAYNVQGYGGYNGGVTIIDSGNDRTSPKAPGGGATHISPINGVITSIGVSNTFICAKGGNGSYLHYEFPAPNYNPVSYRHPGAGASGGGSNYIGGVTGGSTSSGQRSGNGYARITLISISI